MDGAQDRVADVVEECLSGIPNRYGKGELAYLALTSKIEGPIRDDLALSMRSYYEPRLQVAREWKRCDIAALLDGKPLIIIELKAFYTFDLFVSEQPQWFFDQLRKDLQKRSAFKDASTLFGVLIATHPTRPIAHQYQQAVKYYSGINQALQNRGSENMKENSSKIVQRYFQQAGSPIIWTGLIKAGECYEIPVELMLWLIDGSTMVR